jgi:hypothetical protein
LSITWEEIMTFGIKALSTTALFLATVASAQADPTAVSSVFATGGSGTGGTNPDSVTIGDGSVWIEYGNNADSTGAGEAARSSNTAPAAQSSTCIRSQAWSMA